MANITDCRRRRRGSVLIETIIVLLFLLFLTFGAIEYGWIMLKMSQVNNAARNGARVAAMRITGAQAAAESKIDTMMAAAGISGHSVTFAPEGGVDDANSGTLITVTVEVAYSPEGGTDPVTTPSHDLGSLFPVPSQLRASVTMAKE